MARFYYKPILVTSLTYVDRSDYANNYPEHQQWLLDNGIQKYRVSNYVWPILLSQSITNQFNIITCEMLLEIIDDDHAAEFSVFSGMPLTI